MAAIAPRCRPVAVLLAAAALATAGAGGAGGLDVAGMDPGTSPGDDFFGFANGRWVEATQIPDDSGQYGNFDVLAENTRVRIAAIVQKAAQSPAPAGSDARLVGDFYAAAMDEDGIEARGLHPFDALRDEINAIGDRHELARVLGETLRADVDALNATSVVTGNLFGLWIAQDLDDPSRYVPFLLQGGLGMPDRSYYLDESAAAVAMRASYLDHVAAMLALAGVPRPAERAQHVVELERRIAAVHWSRVETRDVLKGDNHWKRGDFRTRAPGLDWPVFFGAAQLPAAQQDFVVWQPGAIRGIAALVGSEPLATWRDYLLLHALEHRAQWLPKAIANRHFSFHGTALSGIPAQGPRWKRALAATNDALGDAVGRLYVAHYFPPEARARAAAIVERVRSALGQRLERLDWMAPETRTAALAKLARIQVGIGYPEQWRDYAPLRIARGDAYGNAERAAYFEYRRQLAKLGQKVDRGEWVIAPQDVNAVNLPAMNAINLAAGLLQPPFFDPDGDPALNYGAIGAAIGHELSHGFDDRGGRFDAGDRLRNWWTEADAARFRAAGERLAGQFGAYQALPDQSVDGRLTLGENMADLAGVVAALDAYHAEAQGRAADVVDGYTGDQRFFIAYAQFWRSKSRESALRRQLIVDTHAPARFRAATVRNVDAWYQAFDVRPGQALYLAPADRVRIW